MTTEEITELFEKYNDDEFLEFDRIPAERKLSQRPDLNAFLLLDRIAPGTGDMVCSAGHDIIYLTPDLDELETATEEQIIDLIRSGVMFEAETDSLSMFV